MISYNKKIKLLVFPSYISIINDIKILIINKIKQNNININKISSESSFLVLDVSDFVAALNSLSHFPGIKKIVITYSTKSNIKKIVNTIVSVGKKNISSNQSFYIKVFSDNPYFLERDVQFMSTGSLLEHDARSLVPSMDEKSADKTIYCYIGNRDSFIGSEFVDGVGGFPYGYHNRIFFCVFYDHYSLLCIKKIIYFGFVPEILVLYFDHNDLKNKLKDLNDTFFFLDIKKLKLHLFPLVITKKISSSLINQPFVESVIVKILTDFTCVENVVIPFDISLHPFWLIENSMILCFKRGKTPWLPSLFIDVDTHKNSKNIVQISSCNSQKQRYNKYIYDKFEPNSRLIKNIYEQSKKKNKTLLLRIKSTNIRTDYINDILDSI